MHPVFYQCFTCKIIIGGPSSAFVSALWLAMARTSFADRAHIHKCPCTWALLSVSTRRGVDHGRGEQTETALEN